MYKIWCQGAFVKRRPDFSFYNLYCIIIIMKFNKYWIIVFVITLANIFIFSTFSKKLETYVSDGLIEKDQALLDSLNKNVKDQVDLNNKNLDKEKENKD